MSRNRDTDQRKPSPNQPERRRFLKAALASATTAGAVALPLPGSADQRRVKQPQAATGIPQRPLGNTGINVPILHLGTSQYLDQTYDKILHRSFREGVNWFDTALSYGWGS